MLKSVDDVRIRSLHPLISPALLHDELPGTSDTVATVDKTRDDVISILNGKSERLVAVVGPCSIHDVNAAMEYGLRLKKLIDRFADDLCIIMRVYFEKPRTIIGWKGLINDPHLNDSFAINEGLRMARKLLVDLNGHGIPCGSEFLDMITPQYITDLISWGAIGARTTESQIHRELASGLSMPVGFKNGTDGNIQIAIDAIRSAQYQHHFLSVTKLGLAAIVSTLGNKDCHIILRGSQQGTNYDAESVNKVCQSLQVNKLMPRVMIDCSHGNSRKDYRNQAGVALNIAEQIEQGSQTILGVMLESHLQAGRQDLVKDKELVYGQSITDACIDWQETEKVLADLAHAVAKRRSLLKD